MDITFIVAIVIGAVFLIGGPIVGRYANKASEKAAKEELQNTNKK